MSKRRLLIMLCVLGAAALSSVDAYSECCSCYSPSQGESSCDSFFLSEEECAEACWDGGWEFYIWNPDAICTYVGGWWACYGPDEENCCECSRSFGTVDETRCYEGGFTSFVCEEIIVLGEELPWDACNFHSNAVCLDNDTCLSLHPLHQACCMLDHVCEMMAPDECIAAEGIPQGPNTMCTRAQACCLGDGTCWDLDPLCCDEIGGTAQGEDTGCVDSIVACCMPDGSCFETDPSCCDDIGGVIMGGDCTSTDCSQMKWIQAPDVTANAINVALGGPQDDLRIIADDFFCTQRGLITDVHFWGSWMHGEAGRISNIELAFYSDDPVGPGGSDPDNRFSKPDELLWNREFGEGSFTVDFSPIGFASSWWWDPMNGDLFSGQHADLQLVNVYIEPEDAFRQLGSPDEGVVYWLSIRVTTVEGEFGWRTRDWPEHYNDDAVYDFGSELPRLWKEMRYPEGHPYHGLEDDSIDMAFVLTTTPEEGPWTKWVQPPHGEFEGFDAASDLWVPSMTPKWKQLPDPLLPGLHSHDLMVEHSYQAVVLADDWICGGGDVIQLNWWGNYEVGDDGTEQRGSGIDHFHISIHRCGSGGPWCLPMEPEMFGFNVPYSTTLEQPTTMVNPEGSRIYYYEFPFPMPVPQEPMMHYWVDVTAVSNDPVDPPLWRWQESNRSDAFLGWAPGATKTEPPYPGLWRSITWPDMTFTDFAFELINAIQSPLEPNKVVTDDFKSDGRPIEGVRWHGSYFDEQYAPYTPSVEPYAMDGWLISFHHDLPGLTCPPENPPTVLGAYFAPVSAVTITGPLYQDCHGHDVYEYEVDLASCCLLCSEIDPRNGLAPAEEGVFAEYVRHWYWLSIQAVTGVTFVPDSEPACFPIITGREPSPTTEGRHFWGWHTSPGPITPNNIATEEACTGHLEDLTPYPEPCWYYGNWVKQDWLCQDVPAIPEVHMAFSLLTYSPTSSCPMDLDLSGFVGVGDINMVKANYGACPFGICKAYDLDDSGFVGVGDINIIKANFGPCPNGACWYDDSTGLQCVETFESDCLTYPQGNWLGEGTHCP